MAEITAVFIFRFHVGAALLERDRQVLENAYLGSGVSRTKRSVQTAETAHERSRSAYLKSMSVCGWRSLTKQALKAVVLT